MYTFNLTEEQN